MDRSKRIGKTCLRKSLAVISLATALICATNVPTVYASGTENAGAASQQQSQKLISGTVIDASGQPVVGASIVEKGTTNGIMTDENGRFSIEVKTNSKLVVSFIGFTTQEILAANNLKIVLAVDNEFLDEVVVVGYGTQKKANLTGAVSTVDVGKTLENRPLANVGKALQGAVPGLTVLNTNGKINNSPSITIRGLGTLSNSATSNPLIVVDGVVMDDLSYVNPNDIENISVLKDAASTSIYGTRAAFGVLLITTKAAQKTDKVSITYSNNFGFETPTVLPNYPNGVEQVKALMETNSRAGLAAELFGMNFDDDYLKNITAWEERHNWKKSDYREMILGDDFDIQENGKGNYYTDWDVQKIFFKKTTPTQTHNFAVQGTSGKTSYYMSFGYNKEEGTMRFGADQLKKWNVTSNITTNPTDWLQMGVRFNYSKKDYSTANNIGQGAFQYLWRWPSFFGPYGTYNGEDFRPLSYRKQAGTDKYYYDYTRIGGFAKATILPGLTVNADYTYMVNEIENKYNSTKIYGYNNWSTITAPGYISTSTGVGESSTRDVSYAFNAYVDYNKTWKDAHHLHAMVGVNAEEGEMMYHDGYRKDLLDENLPEFNLATGDMTAEGSHTHWGTAGYFGRINYDYKGIYLLELNGRYDGSSKFPSDEHWAFFPSASAGYRFSEEPYFEPLRQYITAGKLRASFGEIGNEAIGSNRFVSTLTRRDDDDYGSINWVGNGTQKVTMYNLPDLVSSSLSWERIQTLDIGLDLSALKNELNLTFDWYQRNTLDMLAPAASLPAVLGDSAPYTNNGTLRTRGWELAIDWNHTFSDVHVYANASIGDFKSKVTKWDNETKSLDSTYEGMTYGDIWGFETDRLFTPDDFAGYDENGKPTAYASGIADQTGLQQGSFVYGPGDIKFKDLDGSGVIDGGSGTANDHGDLKVIGNTQPRYQYSFRLGASWKGIDIDAFFQGVGKRDIWTRSAFTMPFFRGADAIYSNEMDYWQGTFQNSSWTVTNADAKYPRLWPDNSGVGTVDGIAAGNHNYYPQSKFVSQMSYLRLKNLTVGYTLPQNITRKIYLEKVRVYFSGENLLEVINNCDAPFDPEINSGNGNLGYGVFGRIDPMYRTYSFGVQITL
ncbi:MAG: TonB-dependent receptor [Bacteroidales bacterium]